MYALVLPVHSLLRWIVILTGLVAAARGLAGWLGHRPWSPGDDRAGLLFVIAFDLQLIIGLVMYLFASPITTSAFRHMGSVMQNSVVRFWVVEHLTAMLLGLALAHVGRVRVRRADEPALKHRHAAVLFGLALLVVCAGVPWPFMPVARPLWPW